MEESKLSNENITEETNHNPTNQEKNPVEGEQNQTGKRRKIGVASPFQRVGYVRGGRRGRDQVAHGFPALVMREYRKEATHIKEGWSTRDKDHRRKKIIKTPNIFATSQRLDETRF